MGSELVARLREMGGRLRLEAADLLETQQAEIERLNAEAADLLETQQAEIERLNAEAADLLETQQAEIERLNAEALHPDCEKQHSDQGDRSLEAVEHLKEPLQQGN